MMRKTLNLFDLLARKKSLFINDILNLEEKISKIIKSSNFLVIGGAGTIGQACVKEIFKRCPNKLHVIDINENNLVELVRDIRSSFGYIKGDFRTFTLDVNSSYLKTFINKEGQYDYIMNLSAMKHVRNEKDPYSLMRMIEINFLNTKTILDVLQYASPKKYFCVSTDKASDPINLMGASKRIMEYILFNESNKINISTARFANVIFSDGSLMYGVENRFKKQQPISAPYDIKRYFVTSEEAGQLCLMSTLFGENNQIFFPNPKNKLKAFTFIEIIEKYLKDKGYKIKLCNSEHEARNSIKKLLPLGAWPCYFFKTDTSGEKEIEQFYSSDEKVQDHLYESIGVLNMFNKKNYQDINIFLGNLNDLLKAGEWNVQDIINEFKKFLPEFNHFDAGKSLEEKM